MLGTHFYHEIIRKTIVGFGTLFNNIELRRTDKSGNIIQTIKVPLAYGPREKFLARIDAEPQLDGRAEAQIQLPRIAFEMKGISYNPGRKQSPVQFCLTNTDGEGTRKTYVPVPYNLDFELNILAKTQDDALQITEQILPFFQPSFNLSIELVKEAGVVRDVPIVMKDIFFNDSYEGDFDTRRSLVYTIKFTLKTYIYGPTTDVGLIKKAITKEYSTTDVTAPGRYREYSVTPKALEDKNDDGVVDTIDDSLLMPGDDFGFNETSSYFEDV